MNRLKLLVVLSVALNVGFITLLVLHTASSSNSRGRQEEHSLKASPAERSAAEAREAANTDATDPASTLARAYRRLHSALRATGLPRDEVRRILRGAALADLHDDMRHMRKELFASSEFWTNQPMPFGTGSAQAVEFQRKMVELRREKEAALSGLVAEDNSLVAPWHVLYGQIDLADVSGETRKAVMMLEEDYGLLRMEIEARSTLGGALAEDAEALRLLEQERLDDLSALLSSEELEEYELRHSETAQLLRLEIRHFNPTEKEFRDIFRLRREAVTKFPGGLAETETARLQQQLEAEQEMQSRLREVLGANRFSEFQRAQDHEYQQLAALAQRLDLPTESINQVYDFKTLIEHQEVNIQADSNLSEADRHEAMQLLAGEARRMVRETLGDRGYQAYTAAGGWWLRRLDSPTGGEF